MRAVVCHESKLEVEDVPDPVPGRGQVLLEVVRGGICGSDLHALRHADQLADLASGIGYHHLMRPHESVVMGHEFSGRVLDYGPGTRKSWASGTPVVSLPMVQLGGKVQMTGLSAKAPGAYAERVLVQEPLTMDVPNGLSPETAALTEPMAVAWHAVRRSGVRKRETAVVIGCGPIGLAVILMLKARGVQHVIASDFSPGRRALAEVCGADVVFDPGVDSPWTGFEKSRYITDATELADLALSTMDEAAPGAVAAVVAGAPRRRGLPEPSRRAGGVRVCRGARNHQPDRQRGAARVAGRRGRGLHGAGHVPACDGDQQGDRPAVRVRLPAPRVPRDAAHDRRRHRGPDTADHRDSRPRGRLGGVRRPRATRSDTQRS